MKMWMPFPLLLLPTVWLLSLVTAIGGDAGGALTGIILAKLLSSSFRNNNGNSQQTAKAPILIPPRICIQKVPVPVPFQVPVRVLVPYKVKERVEVKVPVPFKVKEPFAIRVPFPVPYPVQQEAKSEPTTKPPRLPIIQLPPNIIHNFIPQQQHKFVTINRRPLVQHLYPKPKPLPEPEPEPEAEHTPEPQHEPVADKEIDEESDMKLLAQLDAQRGSAYQTTGQHFLRLQRGFPQQQPFAGFNSGMQPANTPFDPSCLMPGLDRGMRFPGAMGGFQHPFQGMSRPPAVFNHMMSAPLPLYTPTGLPVTSLQTPADYSGIFPSPDSASFQQQQGHQGWKTALNAAGSREKWCHKVCHED